MILWVIRLTESAAIYEESMGDPSAAAARRMSKTRGDSVCRERGACLEAAGLGEGSDPGQPLEHRRRRR
jgi:hypothetical protein